jgi:hypothetical protein
MRPNKYVLILLAVLFSSRGTYLLIDSVQHSGKHAEEFILLGGTLTALGLAGMFFVFKRRAQVTQPPQHMRRRSFSSRGPNTQRIEK